MTNSSLVRPRLNDFYGLPFTQEEVDFAIPFLNEDLPLHIDPFLLWKSPSQQDNALHLQITNCFNQLGNLYIKGKEKEAKEILIKSSECAEVGLGDSKTKAGKQIGESLADTTLALFKNIPQINTAGFIHFEEIQLLVDGISKDRVSDITATFIKSFLIDFTIDQCQKYKIPIRDMSLEIYDCKKGNFITEKVPLPENPEKKPPILLVPKRWLKFIPWINYDNYFDEYYAKEILKPGETALNRVALLNFNRQNYGMVKNYTAIKERTAQDCHNDPLFKAIPVVSVDRKLDTILKLPTGKTDNADKQYEDNLCGLMASLLYPHLDFADMQSRTESNVLIRDLIFYCNRSHDFLREVYEKYDCRQIVMELKNVEAVNNDHVDQLNRYLKEHFGRFGIIFTRKPPPSKVFKNTIDLWSGQRKCILIMTDEDLKYMCQLYKDKQRDPIDVIARSYAEFNRKCPS